MSTARQIVSLFQDSPNYGRDRANLISSYSIGTMGLLLNGVVLSLVMPLLLAPDDRLFRNLTENVEFGQLLALILLGGASAFATLLVPLRMVTVFWGPRIGGYFDQIVLSGISPLRFVIGKATSQNLFLALILFILLPYLVLSFTLGGVDLVFFLAALSLIWLYCMALALVTLWASLYVNELIAAVLVIAGAAILCGLGCAPLPVQPFLITPFPPLVQPLYATIPDIPTPLPNAVPTQFLICATTLSAISLVSLVGIYLGPLYGIVRENSMFGEVVREGDTKRKRWLRFRLHIQRPSEIAFFYENRSDAFLRQEGLIRWGAGLGGIFLLSAIAYGVFAYVLLKWVVPLGGQEQWHWAFDFHVTHLIFHGVALLLGIFLFSHTKNTTQMNVPVAWGRAARVGWLDTRCFFSLAVVSALATVGFAYWFEFFVASPIGHTIFPPNYYGNRGPQIDMARFAWEGTLVITFSAAVIFAMQRLTCLFTWIKSFSFVGVTGLYLIGILGLPVFAGFMCLEVRELREIEVLSSLAPVWMMISPMTVLAVLCSNPPPRFPDDPSTLPFYVSHGLILATTIYWILRRKRKLEGEYLSAPRQEASDE